MPRLRIVPQSTERYVVEYKSVSSHCCFVASVIDQTRPDTIFSARVMAETFTNWQAELIAKALNHHLTDHSEDHNINIEERF